MAYLTAANDEYLLVLDLPGQYETPSWLHLWKFPSHGATEKCELEKMDGSVGPKKKVGSRCRRSGGSAKLGWLIEST